MHYIINELATVPDFSVFPKRTLFSNALFRQSLLIFDKEVILSETSCLLVSLGLATQEELSFQVLYWVRLRVYKE